MTIPLNGIFRLLVTGISSITTRASSVGSVGWQTSSGVSDNDFLDAINGADSVRYLTAHQAMDDPTLFFSGSLGFRFSFSDDCISLNGDSPISFDNLPAGFNVIGASTSPTLSAGLQSGGNTFGGIAIASAELTLGTVKVGLFYSDSEGPSSFSNDVGGSVSASVPVNTLIDYPTVITISDLLSLGPQFIISGNASLINGVPNPGFFWVGTLSVDSFSVVGSYQIIQYTWNIDAPPKVQNGDTITITSDGDNPLDLDDITEVDVQYLDPSTQEIIVTPITVFTTQGPRILVFTLDGVPSGVPKIRIFVKSNGRQFSGSVLLGELLTIFFTDGTGIYKLVPGKTNDTLYIQDVVPYATINVKIPDPTLKTAFVP